jgi:hypothetical protein
MLTLDEEDKEGRKERRKKRGKMGEYIPAFACQKKKKYTTHTQC